MRHTVGIIELSKNSIILVHSESLKKDIKRIAKCYEDLAFLVIDQTIKQANDNQVQTTEQSAQLVNYKSKMANKE